MKRFLFWALMAISVPCPYSQVVGQQAADESNVSWKAAQQIAIRGNMIERVGGGIQSPEDDVALELAKLPADDSGKWNITVLTMPGCRACEKLKSDLATSKEWAGASLINVQDHTKSLFHYSAYRYDDPTVRDWRRGLDAWLKGQGKQPVQSYPQIVLQPPANGSYGPKTEVVFWQVGYNGNAGKLRDALVKEMQTFAKLMKAPQLLRSEGGHGQLVGGWPAPFPIPPASVPASEGDWSPDVLIPPSQAATAAELQLACPSAPAEFLFALLARGVTKEEAQTAWLTEKQRQEITKMQQQLADALEKLKTPPTPAAQPVPAPSPASPPQTAPPPAANWLDLALKVVAVFAGGTLSLATVAAGIGYGIRGILWLRQKKVDAGGKPAISDQMAAVLNRLDDFLIAFGEKNQAPQKNQPQEPAKKG